MSVKSEQAHDDYRNLFDPSTLADLHDLIPVGQAQLGGVTPGVNDANVPQIRKMRAGDIAFFSGQGFGVVA
ncbi:hypothetical protein OG788_46230 [Streptomyces sp. NBC_00647]|uniref:hypothetical protein n=1 Tax=Streptomyces sp. NBC_00647 TaxID=2975796 RepID=UPI003243660D